MPDDRLIAVSTPPPTGPDPLGRVRALLRAHPLVDGHNDLPWAARTLAGYDWDRLDIAGRTPTHTDLPRLAEGGVGAQFWSVFVPSTLPPDQAVVQTLEQVDAVHAMVARYPDRLGLATTAAQVREVFASGRIASLLGAEGGHSIGCSLGTLRALHRLGVRYLTLTHNDNTPWADSATDAPAQGGLSAFGRAVVREMNRVGMLVDLSHVSADTMRDALAESRAPVIFSHSSARALCDSPRNVPDDVLVTMAAGGGVCMAVFAPPFVSQARWDWRVEAGEEARAEGIAPTDLTAFTPFLQRWAERHPPPPVTLADVVEHVEHLREVAGVEHVGLGGDYDGVPDQPEGLADVTGYPRLLAALADRGWSDADLVALAGGNVLRVLEQAEQVAARLQREEPPGLVRIEQLDVPGPATTGGA